MEESPLISPQITEKLEACAEGKLVPFAYDELHRQAHRYLNRERRNHTLQTTGLVREAYLRLIGQRFVDRQSRAHFFGMAATMVRRILVYYADDRNRLKRSECVNV